MGSRQPLFYSYIYGAGLTDAQTHSVAEMARAFYSRYTWQTLSLFPLHSLSNSLLPVNLFASIRSWVWSNEPAKLSDLATLSFASQYFCFECALGLIAAPVVILGFFRASLRNHAGKVILSLYLVPTLIVALVYRIDWPFQLHIVCLYHRFVLFLWVFVVRAASLRSLSIGLALVALEGVVCVLFSDGRVLLVKGIRLNQFRLADFLWLTGYLSLWSLMIAATYRELLRSHPSAGVFLPSPSPGDRSAFQIASIAGRKLLAGLLGIAVVFAIYALYCWRLYSGR